MSGRFILVVGPSGSGKSVLLDHLHSVHPEIIFPVSCTTRARRPGEVSGEKYYFVDKGEFDKRREHGDFLEWASYGNNYYGTLKSEILPPLAQGKTVVREVEVQGARQLIEKIPQESLRVVFIDAGSWNDLERRIRARAPMSDVELLARRKRYEDENAFKPQADSVVQNADGKLEEAKNSFVKAVEGLISK